jgi:hypothetical protein
MLTEARASSALRELISTSEPQLCDVLSCQCSPRILRPEPVLLRDAWTLVLCGLVRCESRSAFSRSTKACQHYEPSCSSQIRSYYTFACISCLVDVFLVISAMEPQPIRVRMQPWLDSTWPWHAAAEGHLPTQFHSSRIPLTTTTTRA